MTPADTTFSGSLATAGAIVANQQALAGIAGLALQVSGTYTGSLVFEASLDGATWASVPGTVQGGGAPVSSTTGSGVFFFGLAGFRWFRVRCSSYTSGTANVYAVASLAPHWGPLDGIAGFAGTAGVPFTATSAADITTTTPAQVKAAAGSGQRHYITAVSVSNLSASVNTRVDIQDGNGGPVLWSGPAASAGGGFEVTFPTPLQGSVNTAVFAACGTTAAQVRVSVAGFVGA